MAATHVAPVASKKEPKRYVKGLILTDTLGKGTFGYVKLGLKEETGQQFALKFLMKNNKRFKIDQIRTEIECMKRIKHKHVVQLLHADYDCKYPNQQNGIDDTVLMVLEYAPGGDLYDILFYSGKLDERVTKTYFLQLAQGVEALHKVGVTHRDLKANNILLDHKFRLKITDFGLSHVFEGENIKANRMKTTWVGTRGYQAPELILNRPFSYKCDIFSMGVVVFTLLCGHQPFKTAAASDPWYKCIAAGKPKKFWNAHSNDKMSKDCMNIIERMIAYQPKERAEIPALYEHAWVQESHTEPPYQENELYQVMRKLHKVATNKKMNDPKRLKRIQNSQVDGASRAIPEGAQEIPVPAAPKVIPMHGCFLINEGEQPIKVILEIHDMIEQKKMGKVDWIPDKYQIDATVTLGAEDQDFVLGVKCRIFQHPELEGRYICDIQKDVTKGEMEENLDAWDDIWKLASTHFEEAYQPTYSDDLFKYDPGMFAEEEEVQSKE
jgi:serine/threonine protein kinase